MVCIYFAVIGITDTNIRVTQIRGELYSLITADTSTVGKFPSVFFVYLLSKRLSPSNSGEYDYLGLELTRNTRVRYIYILKLILINPTPYGPIQRFYPNLSWYHIIYLLHRGYYNMYMFCHSLCNRGSVCLMLY